jgi:hypothetical protein
MLFHMLQIRVFGLPLFLVSHMEQYVETAEITVVNDVCNLLLLNEHNPMYSLGKRFQEAAFFDT